MVLDGSPCGLYKYGDFREQTRGRPVGQSVRITISAKKTEVTDALREYTREKLGKLARYFDGIISCRVVLSVQRKRHVAEVELHVVKGGVIMAIAESEDLYRSLDTVMDKLPRQLKKYKAKLHPKKSRGK